MQLPKGGSAIAMQRDKILRLHCHDLKPWFDIAANQINAKQIKQDGKRGENPKRTPSFAETVPRHQWTVPPFVPY